MPGVALHTPLLARAGGQAASPQPGVPCLPAPQRVRLGCEQFLRHSSRGGASPRCSAGGRGRPCMGSMRGHAGERDSRDNAQEVTPPHCEKGHSRIYKA